MNWFLLGLAVAALCVLVGFSCFLIGYVVGARDEARSTAETLRELREQEEGR